MYKMMNVGQRSFMTLSMTEVLGLSLPHVEYFVQLGGVKLFEVRRQRGLKTEFWEEDNQADAGRCGRKRGVQLASV